MQALRHSHIIDLLDVVFHANRFYIVLECATGGDLKDHIRSQVRASRQPAPSCFAAAVLVAPCQTRGACRRKATSVRRRRSASSGSAFRRSCSATAATSATAT